MKIFSYKDFKREVTKNLSKTFDENEIELVRLSGLTDSTYCCKRNHLMSPSKCLEQQAQEKSVASKTWRERNFEPEALTKFLQEQKGEMAYDIGASKGDVVEILRQHFHFVSAFEPLSENLQKRITASDWRNVDLFNTAISNHNGELFMPVKIISGEQQISTLNYSTFGETFEYRKVRCQTLDSFTLSRFSKPSLVVVDVEGHELKVMQGATSVIENIKPVWCIEIHQELLGQRIKKMLRELYEFEEIRPYPRDSILNRDSYQLIARTK